MTLLSACQDTPTADILFFNATVHVMDSTGTVVNAMAVRDGKVLAIGDEAKLRAEFRIDEEIDLGGSVVFPGFIDAHAHLHALGEKEVILDLTGTGGIEEILSLVRSTAGSTDGWIRGRGWDQNDWAVQEFPDRRLLDDVCPDQPVFLVRIDGHAAWVNTAALEAAGVNDRTPDPEGGRFMRRPDGSLSGVLLDNAIEILRAALPPSTPEETRHAMKLAVRRCLSVGLTGVHDMGMRREYEVAVRDLIDAKDFPLRLVAYLDGRGEYWEQQLARGREIVGRHQLLLAGLKLYADGALGSRGAYLLRPYTDDDGNHGLRLIDADTVKHEARRAIDRGMQVCVHAIGDGANRLVLNAYEAALDGAQPPTLPLRIEHVQVLSQEDIPRFSRLGVLPSMQPTHCTSDMYWAEARLGDRRIHGAYAWRSLIDLGSRIPGGSDFPIESPDPLEGIYAAAFRLDADGIPADVNDIGLRFSIGDGDPAAPERYEDGWYGAQRMTRREAVLAFTAWAAAAAGCSEIHGTLLPGRYADFVLLSQDILDVAREDFLSTRVLQTWFGGRLAYDLGAVE